MGALKWSSWYLLRRMLNMSTPYCSFSRQFSQTKPASSTGEFIELMKTLGDGDILLEKDDDSGIGILSLHNPKKKNAMSPRMMVKFGDLTEELSQWSKGKAVIVHGTNGSLCSGGDLDSVMHDIGTPPQGRMMCEFMQGTLQKFYNLPLVSVAAVEGKAVGGGAELTTACDFRLMKEDAAIGFVHKKLAVTTGWGGGTRLVHIVGRSQALNILLSGKLLSLHNALQISLVDGVLSSDSDSVDCCKEWLATKGFLDGRPPVLQALKSMVANASALTTDESLAIEKDIFTSVWGSTLHKEALEKRPKHR